jgi:hypothetical protein
MVLQAQIANLPINDRNFQQLANLIPGAAPSPSYDPTKRLYGGDSVSPRASFPSTSEVKQRQQPKHPRTNAGLNGKSSPRHLPERAPQQRRTRHQCARVDRYQHSAMLRCHPMPLVITARTVEETLAQVGCDPVRGLASIAQDERIAPTTRVHAYAALLPFIYPRPKARLSGKTIRPIRFTTKLEGCGDIPK